LSAKLERPPDTIEAFVASSDGLDASQPTENVLTLADLPLGARLILRCRKDWRDATVAATTLEGITLSVSSPSGHTYRVRRPFDSPLSLDGSIPVLGEGSGWRAGRVRYDLRW
jgi:hypothetical protein